MTTSPLLLGANSASSGGSATVSDTAYDATTWDADTTNAPSKNAVRDKFETLAATYVARATAPEVLVIAVSDETTALTTGTAKVTFRMPFAMTVTAVRGSLTTTQASGSILTVDINEAGTSIISTKLTIDNTELTSTTAATPAVISDAALADDAQMTVDIDQVGDGTAKGLKIYLIGTRVV